jgi:hypothetical protein
MSLGGEFLVGEEHQQGRGCLWVVNFLLVKNTNKGGDVFGW